MLQSYNGVHIFPVKKPLAEVKFTFQDNYVLIGKLQNQRLAYSTANANLLVTYRFDFTSVWGRSIMLKTFNSTHGSYDSIYFRTHLCSLELLSDYDGGTTMVVRNTREDLRYLSFVNSVGVYHENFTAVPMITDISVSPGGSMTLTFDVGGGASLKAGEFLEHIYFGRFNSDTLTFKYDTLTYSTTEITCITASPYDLNDHSENIDCEPEDGQETKEN